MIEIYPREYPEGERELHEVTENIMHELVGRRYNFSWTNAMSMRLDAKVHNYLGNWLKHNPDIAGHSDSITIADALSELSETGLKNWLNNPKRTLAERLAIHNRNTERAAAKLSEKKVTIPETPFTIETQLEGGRYCLAKLTTREHFQKESAWLKHCLGGEFIDAYWNAYEQGKAEYFTVQEMWGRATLERRREILLPLIKESPIYVRSLLSLDEKQFGGRQDIVAFVTDPKNDVFISKLESGPNIPVTTIEYIRDRKAISQMKTIRGEKTNVVVNQSDPFKGAVAQAIKYIESGTAYDSKGKPYVRGLEMLYDKDQLIPPGKILITDGNTVSFDEAAELDPDRIVNIELKVTADISPNTLKKLCERTSMNFNFTGATQEQRDAIIHVKGSIYDAGHRQSLIQYVNLISIDGTFRTASTTPVDLPNLVKVGEDLELRSSSQVTCSALEVVNGNLFCGATTFIDFKKLQNVGKNLEMDAKFIDLPSLSSVGGVLHASNAEFLYVMNLITAREIRVTSGAKIKIGSKDLQKLVRVR